jgi:hypothetical protein
MPEPSVRPFVDVIGETKQPANGHRTGYTAVELLATDFPEPRFAVPGIIAEGLNLLVGAPKLGKSWLALNIAIAVASGGRALGKVPVEQGGVFYLALEDGPRRLKKRLGMVLGTEPAPEGLHFETEWRALIDGGADDLSAWLAIHPDTRLVVVDVIARLRSPVRTNTDRYLLDYMVAEEVKRVADFHGVAVVAVHHTRKAAADDFIESVSGTNGLAGAADTIIALKRSRGQADAVLHATGRDIEERELALNFDAQIGTWALLGDAEEWRMSETRRQIIEAIREADQALRPKQIAEEAEADYGVVKHLVRRMVDDGQLITDGKGFYSLLLHSIHHVHRSLTEHVHRSPSESERSERSERLPGDSETW